MSEPKDGEIQLQFASEEQMLEELERRGAVGVLCTLRRDGKDSSLDADFMAYRGHAVTCLGLLASAMYRINKDCEPDEDHDGSD